MLEYILLQCYSGFMNKKAIVLISLLIAAFGGLITVSKLTREEVLVKAAVTVHKTLTCGCCANYVGYLQNKGYSVTVVNHNTNSDMDKEKEKLSVPTSLYSCHTTVFDEEDYYAEGHIPIEAIDKLIVDRPDIAGIGMPGMPSASPGMPGQKLEPFDISQVSKKGEVSAYMTL